MKTLFLSVFSLAIILSSCGSGVSPCDCEITKFLKRTDDAQGKEDWKHIKEECKELKSADKEAYKAAVKECTESSGMLKLP